MIRIGEVFIVACSLLHKPNAAYLRKYMGGVKPRPCIQTMLCAVRMLLIRVPAASFHRRDGIDCTPFLP